MTWQIRPFCEIDPSISVPAVLTFLQDWFILKQFLTLPSLNFWVSSKEVLESSGFSGSVQISVIRYMILQQHLVSSAWILWGPVVKHTAMKDQMSCSCLTWQSPVCLVFVYVILAGLLAVFYFIPVRRIPILHVNGWDQFWSVTGIFVSVTSDLSPLNLDLHSTDCQSVE